MVDITSDAAVEGYEGWGGYGSSKAALDQLGNVLAAEQPGPAGVLVRPGRHADPDAPGRLPGRGHLRPAGARAVAPRPAPARRRVPAERPLPRRRPAVAGMTADRRGRPGAWPSTCRPALEAGSPPEARGLTRDAVRMLVAHRATGVIEHSTFALLPAFLEPGDLVVVNTSATIPAAVDAVAADGTPLVVHLSTQSRRRALGGRAAPADPAAAPPAGTVRRRRPRLTSARRPRATDRGAVRHGRPPLGGPAAAARSRPLAWLAVPRPADPVRLRRAAVAAQRLPERVRRRAGQRRDAERRAAVHARGHHPPGGQGRRRHADRAAHRRGLARGRRAALPGAGPGARRRRPSG